MINIITSLLVKYHILFRGRQCHLLRGKNYKLRFYLSPTVYILPSVWMATDVERNFNINKRGVYVDNRWRYTSIGIHFLQFNFILSISM